MASWVPVVMTFNQTVGYVSWIDGGSMKPALNPDTSRGWRDLVFLLKFGQRSPGALSIGDIIMLRSPTEPEKVLVKRVVGTAGDEILTRGSYPKKTCRVPTNHLWVEGDNASQSIDSNTFGPVSIGMVLGKATTILFPPSRIGPIPSAGGREARLSN
jgi:inner membrane protease subunit 2